MRRPFQCIVFSLITAALAWPQPPETSPRDLTGTWQGTWNRADGDSRIIVQVKSTHNLGLQATLYLVTQPGLSMKLDKLTLQGSAVNYTISGTGGNYKGALSGDGNSITGNWVQGSASRELNLTRVTDGVTPRDLPAPTLDQLSQYLDASYHRGQLISQGSAPFHLVARIDFFVGDNQVYWHATLDELWLSPLHWKLTVTNGEDTFTEVDNGTGAWTTGQIEDASDRDRDPRWASVTNFILHAEAALFAPYHSALLTTHRLGLAGGTGRICIDAEPELPELRDAASNVALAKTTYCLNPYDLSLRQAHYPNGYPDGYAAELHDVAPFGDKLVARTIDVTQNSRLVRIHITTLESIPNTMDLPAPPGSKNGKAHSQEDMLSDEIMRGQPLSRVPLMPLLRQQSRCICTVSLNLHTDINGKVTGSDLLNDSEHIMTPAVAEAVKQYTFRVSWQGDHPVAIDHPLTIFSSTP